MWGSLLSHHPGSCRKIHSDPPTQSNPLLIPHTALWGWHSGHIPKGQGRSRDPGLMGEEGAAGYGITAVPAGDRS